MNRFIPVSEPSITQREVDYVLQAVKSGWVSSLGQFIDRFERAFAEYIGVSYAVTTSNGTTALHLALVSLGIGRGDEVIIPDLTFVATANAVAYTGAKPVPVDIDRETWCIDPESIRKALTPKTKAIIPVHVYGHPAEMERIAELAEAAGLYVIEDAAEAHGSEYKGEKVGGLGNCGVFSFYGNKVMTTGEGGMITTNDKQIYERAKYLRDQAMSQEKRYWHTEVGFNYRMTNIQAALGLAQLERIEELIGKKREIYGWYERFLGNMENIRLNPERSGVRNIFWMVCLVLEKDTGISRNDLMDKLKARGIDTRPFFHPISQMPMYQGGPVNSVASEISEKGLNLPSGVILEKEDIRWITSQIKRILRVG